MAVFEGMAVLLNMETLLYITLGALLGLLFGIVPGLGGPMVLSLLLPLTFGMESGQAVAMLIAASGAVPFGGSITAILLNTPGTAQNIATTFDGYQLSKQGKGGLALGASATASALGGVFGVIVLILLIPIARNIILFFSYPDFFLLALIGMSVVIVASNGAMIKGLISAGIGLMVAYIGYDSTGFVRFDFDILYLWSGVSLIAVVIGVFAISEMIDLFLKGGTISQTRESTNLNLSGILEGAKSVFQNFGLFLKSSLTGTLVGLIPGVGGTVANFLAYMRAKATVKKDNRFGKGDIRGVIAPESANNATDGAGLVPTVAFGIPGSGEMAILLGALILHGIEAGPQLMTKNVDLIYTMVIALVIANLIASTIGLLMVKQLVKITLVPAKVLAPSIFAVSLLGALAINGYFSEVIIAILFGIIGYFMKKFDYSRVALIIAMVLGPLAEKSLFQTYNSIGFSAFVTRPVSVALIIVLILVLLIPILKNKRKTKGV